MRTIPYENIKEVYVIGPKKVVSSGPHTIIYLPKSLRHLRGKLVQITLEVLEFKEK